MSEPISKVLWRLLCSVQYASGHVCFCNARYFCCHGDICSILFIHLFRIVKGLSWSCEMHMNKLSRSVTLCSVLSYSHKMWFLFAVSTFSYTVLLITAARAFLCLSRIFCTSQTSEYNTLFLIKGGVQIKVKSECTDI